MDDCCEIPKKSKPWYLNSLFLASALLAVPVAASYFFHPLVPFREYLYDYFRKIAWMVALGLLLGGFIERFVPREYISKILSENKRRTVFYAVTLGFLMSVCSHGILALAMNLYKKGASTAVIVSFLLASPWANLPITLMLFGFFGFKAFYIILGALLIALVTGLLFQVLSEKGWVEKNPNTLHLPENFSIYLDLKERLKNRNFSLKILWMDLIEIFQGSLRLAEMVLGWVFIGIGISSLFAAFVPTSFFHRYLGPSLLGLLATLALATVMEVCSHGMAPMAFEIFRQTGAFGNAFIFLMAGVVTDYTEIGLLWSNVGPRTALFLPLITVPQVLLLGFLANHFFH